MKCTWCESAAGGFGRKARSGLMAAMVWLGAVAAFGQAPSLFSDPEDGGEFADKLTLTFLQIMKDPIAIRFEGAGGVEFDSAWQTFGGIVPNMFLECTPRTPIPAGSTVTWTVNPDGTGFETADGQVFPTTSGTFKVAGGGVTVTAVPGEGEAYDPAVDGPVIFDFSEDMDLTIDPGEVISFSQGTWTSVWVDATRVTCTLQGAPEPGDYYYTLSGFLSAGGELVEDFYGSFVIEEGSSGLTVTPAPASGSTYNPSVAGPVRFTFSEEMDLTVEPQTAITFSQGTWRCEWASATLVECTPTSSLAAGVYSYSLTGFRSALGELLPTYSGAFIVLQGGGNEGTPAPACPAESPNLSFPKSMSICGTTFFAWNHALAFPDGSASGFAVDGWSDSDQGSLASLVRLDGQGRVISTVMATDELTELTSGTDPTRVLAMRYPSGTNALVFGVYRVDNNFQAVFERALNVTNRYPEVYWLPDGRVLVAQDLDTEIEVILFAANGDVSWAKRYSSPSFGADDSGGIPGLGGGQSALVRELASGFMLDITQHKTELVGEDFQAKSTNILVRLSADGAVQWAKKYTGLDTFPAPQLGGTEAGALFLHAYASSVPDQGDPTFNTVLVKLNANGDPAWGQTFTGGMLNVTADLPNGKFLLSGSIVDEEGDLNRSLFAIMNSAGTLETQVQLGALDYNYGFGYVDGNRIYYSLTASTSGGGSAEPRLALIGSSNLQLEDWTWRQYHKSVDSALLIPDDRSSSLLFSAFHDATHTLEVVSLNGSLQADAPCALFTNATVQVISTNLTSATVNVVVSPATVQAVNFTPQPQAGTITLETFTLAQGTVCNGGSNPTPVTLSTRLDAQGMVVLEFDTASQFVYTLQRATKLSSPDWAQVEVITGTGARVSRSVNSDGGEGYFRVVTTVP